MTVRAVTGPGIRSRSRRTAPASRRATSCSCPARSAWTTSAASCSRRIQAQAERALKNIVAVLDGAGPRRMADVAKVQIFLADINDFNAVNEVYARLRWRPAPGAATYRSALPRGARIEIEAIAVRS